MKNFFSMKALICVFTGIMSVMSVNIVNAQQRSNGSYQNVIPPGDNKATLSTLMHYTNNHEQELREINEKFQNLETIVDSLQRDSRAQNSKNKDATKSLMSPLASKISNLENENAQLKTELNEIKQRVNEYIQHFAQYKLHIDELKKQQKIQSENIELLHSSLKDLIEAINPQTRTSEANTLYRVKKGDSLGELALQHKTSVEAIKKLNNLTSDKITIGQELKFP